MAEIKVTHVLVVLFVVGAVAVVVLAFTGYVAIGFLNKKDLNKLVDQGTQTVTGYTPAKTPTEAMDKFRDAVLARKYKSAAIYCTKPYADLLERSGDNAGELGFAIDKVRDYAKEKGFKTDKMTYVLHHLDPFPKDIKSGTAPTMSGDNKAVGKFEWDLPILETPLPTLLQELKSMDTRMVNRVLSPRNVFEFPINLVKEGDAWKLDIPVSKEWEREVAYFNDHEKAYHTGLTSFAGDMLNNRFGDKQAFEAEVLSAVRKAK